MTKINADTILEAIDPQKCILCMERKRTAGVNTICKPCKDTLGNDSALKFLHETAVEVYTFWIALCKETLTRHFWIEPGTPTSSMHFTYVLGIPGVKRKLQVPKKKTVEWVEDGELKWKVLDKHALKLLEEVFLTDMQCSDAMVLMAELMGTRCFEDSK